MEIKVKECIKDAIKTAVNKWVIQEGLDIPEALCVPSLEVSRLPAHGDLTTNIAFGLAPYAKKNPKDIAKKIEEIIELPRDICEKIESINGFINFHLAICAVHNLLMDILINKSEYGRANLGEGKKILIEFVSANPTGPLTIAHARQAAVGDTLGNILSAAGYNVEREYYLNDRGRQMNTLALSTRARYMELVGKKEDFPQDGYQGSYIWDIARDIVKKYGDKYADVPVGSCISFFLEYTMAKILEMIKEDLKKFGVQFNNWISEKELISGGSVDKVLSFLREKGYIYEHEGAQWFKSTSFSDDKDRVLIKSTGEMTYLAPDIVYHDNKYRRGFDTLIDIWGPDHHGYIQRMKAAVMALGYPQDSLKILIVQLSTLYKNGKPFSMSTRAGEFVSLKQLLDEVGKDAARYFLIMRRPEAHLDFDLEVAKKETSDNPVYYIQYAHARISSIFKKYKEHAGVDVEDMNWENELDLRALNAPEEMAVIKHLSLYPVILANCSNILSPHLLTDYLEELVSKFHNYYEKYRVITHDEKLTRARIALVYGIKTVLKNALGLLNVSVPEMM